MLKLLKKYIESYPKVSILLMAGVLLLPHLELLQVSIMEARNFIGAREAITDGNWLIPTLNGEPRLSKPPLPTWITAVFAMIFGLDNLWGLRLPGALMVMLLGVGVFTLSRKLSLSKQTAQIGGLVTVTSLYVLLIIFEAPWDIYTYAFGLWALVYLLKAWDKEASYISIVPGGLLLGAAVLSKGPVVLYTFVLPFLIAYGIVFRSRLTKRRVVVLVSWICIGLLIGGSWYLYAYLSQSTDFNEDITREVSNWNSYNKRPFYYYWNFFLQSGVWIIFSFAGLIFYTRIKARIATPKTYQFFWLWVVMGLLLLSLVPEKKMRYVVPLMIPLAVVATQYLVIVFTHFKVLKHVERLPVYLHFGTMGVLGILSLFIGFALEWSWSIVIGGLVVGTMGFVLIRFLICQQIKSAFYLSLCFMCLVPLFFAVPLFSYWSNLDRSTFEDLNLAVLPFYGYEMAMPEMIWEYGDKIPKVTEQQLKSSSLDGPFYLLECSSCPFQLDSSSLPYQLKEVGFIDLNSPKKGNMNYRERLTGTVYLVNKQKK